MTSCFRVIRKMPLWKADVLYRNSNSIVALLAVTASISRSQAVSRHVRGFNESFACLAKRYPGLIMWRQLAPLAGGGRIGGYRCLICAFVSHLAKCHRSAACQNRWWPRGNVVQPLAAEDLPAEMFAGRQFNRRAPEKPWSVGKTKSGW